MTTASGSNIAFLVVSKGIDHPCDSGASVPAGPRYTRDTLRSLLQLVGCTLKHSHKVMNTVFKSIEEQVTATRVRTSRRILQVHRLSDTRVCVSIPRNEFQELLSSCLAQHGYKVTPSADELKVACALKEKRRCVIVLLCGTSGSGKSTLASVLAGRLGINNVISTDSIRHMMRSFMTKDDSPMVWASTYQAGDCLPNASELPPAERTVRGYKAQCELVYEYLSRLVASCEASCSSLICEGVHLSISFVMKLMQAHPSVLPFLVYIKSEAKHVERMAVRAKYMTLDPHKNKYVAHMANIRRIQDYLVRKADKYCVPKVENTNIDRSVSVIHLTVSGCLKRMMKGEPALDPASGTARAVHSEFTQVMESLSSSNQDALRQLRSRTESADVDQGRGSPGRAIHVPQAAAAPSNGKGSMSESYSPSTSWLTHLEQALHNGSALVASAGSADTSSQPLPELLLQQQHLQQAEHSSSSAPLLQLQQGSSGPGASSQAAGQPAASLIQLAGDSEASAMPPPGEPHSSQRSSALDLGLWPAPQPLPSRPSSTNQQQQQQLLSGSPFVTAQQQQQQHLAPSLPPLPPRQYFGALPPYSRLRHLHLPGGLAGNGLLAAVEGSSDEEAGEEEGLEEGEAGAGDSEADEPSIALECGSMYESTDFDELEEEAEMLAMGGGLRGWNAGLLRALWPSFSTGQRSSGGRRISSASAGAGPVSRSGLGAEAGGQGHGGEEQEEEE